MRRELVGGCIGLLMGILFMHVCSAPAAVGIAAYDARVQSGETPLDVPGLAEIISGAVNDAAAERMLAAYYADHAEALAIEFRETNDMRLRALFGMYVTHLAVPYNVVEHAPISLLEFASAPAADCGIYATAQAQIYDALGLRWRRIHIDRGWHGVIEVLIGRQYEVFDATSNVWVNRSIGEMLGGMERSVRYFYTPMLDRSTGAVYRVHIGNEHNAPALRATLAWWGLTIFPSRWDVVAEGGEIE